MSVRVVDVMTPDPVAVRSCASFKEIAAQLREQHANAFPVLDADDTVIGVVSEADLLPKEALEAGYEGHEGLLAGALHRAERGKAAGLTAADIMSRPPVTIGAYDLVSHAAHVMYDRKVSCLPVVDHGRLIGMITRADVLSVFTRADADIRRDILNKIIRGVFLGDPAAFTVTVRDGIVSLSGRPETAEVGHYMINAVRHMEGVVGVRNHLSRPPAAATASVGALMGHPAPRARSRSE